MKDETDQRESEMEHKHWRTAAVSVCAKLCSATTPHPQKEYPLHHTPRNKEVGHAERKSWQCVEAVLPVRMPQNMGQNLKTGAMRTPTGNTLRQVYYLNQSEI